MRSLERPASASEILVEAPTGMPSAADGTRSGTHGPPVSGATGERAPGAAAEDHPLTATRCYGWGKMSGQLTNGPTPESNLGYLFRLAHQRIRGALDDALGDLGISAQEYVILSVFETRPELTTSQLARITQVTRQTMHTAVLDLETAGLIERRPENPRVVLIRPTERGRRTLAAATDRVRSIERAALAGFSAAE